MRLLPKPIVALLNEVRQHRKSVRGCFTCGTTQRHQEVAPAYREKGETGEGGVKHGFRYDVAGHFRRLSAGRLIWVRPHQRGLAHELYVPSVRKVE